MLDKDRTRAFFVRMEAAACEVLDDFPDLAVYADDDDRGKYPSISFRVQDQKEERLKKRRRLEPSNRRKEV